jgi:thiol:disulfide interchange protein DsbD
MKRFFTFGIASLFAILALLPNSELKAQQLNPVSWAFSTENLGNNDYNLVMTGKIVTGWHLYSLNFDDGGPMPLYITFDEADNYSLVGDITEAPKAIEHYDEVFGVNVKYQEKNVTYKQKIHANIDKDFSVKGLIDGQACFDADGQCVLVSEDINFNIKALKKAKVENKTPEKDSKIDPVTETIEEENQDSITVTNSKIETIEETAVETESTPVNKNNSKNKKENKNKSIWGFLLLAIGGGLAGVLTPCVFPMIPMTVSFFLQGNSSKANGIIKALSFGISIILLYTLLGVIVSLTSVGADLTTVLSTSWIANIIFFILFMIFALSFFGLFEITLPTGLANKADKQVDKGGIMASFFMALTLVLVSFSCTGPIVGAILVKGAASGSWLEPTVGMFGFGFGFALPFTILAFSPNWLKKLPKSGGWMNSVKVVFAFVLLAFSMKFLANIDQTYNLGLLSRDIYLAIWIVLFFLLGLYLIGKIKFSHDSELKHVGVFRLLIAVAAFTFSLYLFPGLFGADLTPIASVLPPKTAQNFDLTVSSTDNTQHAKKISQLCEDPKYSDFLHFDNGIQGYFDFEQGMSCAKEQNKPLLLYFSGHSCSNCKQMQSSIWKDSRVQEIFNNEVILTKLYVDDRTKLPEEEWIVSNFDGKTKTTLGKKNLNIQIEKFNVNSQPFYVLIDPNTGKKLIEESIKFEKDPDVFIEFLKKGLKEMDNKK